MEIGKASIFGGTIGGMVERRGQEAGNQ